VLVFVVVAQLWWAWLVLAIKIRRAKTTTIFLDLNLLYGQAH